MLDLLANAPNGGNKQQVAFTLIDDKKQMEHFRQIVCLRMEELAQNGIYPKGFDKASYEDMKHWEETVRPDMLFCSAPHILIPHAPLGNGTPVPDTIIAGTYFEMLCASRGLGAVMMTFPLALFFVFLFMSSTGFRCIIFQTRHRSSGCCPKVQACHTAIRT